MYESYNPFLQIIKSFEGIAHSDTYYKLRKQTTGSKILCALIVAAILNLITFGIGAAKICGDKDLYDFLNEMPNYSYANGSLLVDQKFEDKSSDTYFLIDTSVPYYYTGTDDSGMFGAVNADPIIQKIGDNSGIRDAMIASETNIIRVTYTTGQIQNIKYSEMASIFNIQPFSKSSILSGYKGFIGKWAAILGAIWLPVQFALIFFSVLIYCVMAQIAKSIIKADDDFNTIYWITFYVYIAFTIIKTLIKSVNPFGNGLINTAFFALIIFIIVKTLREGDSDAGSTQFGYVNNDTFGDTFDSIDRSSNNTYSNNSYSNNTYSNTFDNTNSSYNDPFRPQPEDTNVYVNEEPVKEPQTEAPKSKTGLSLKQ